MKKEKIVLSFVATLLGLLVAGIAFFFFSARPNPPSNTKVISFSSPSPKPSPVILLTVSQPKDEDVVSTKTITVSGKTRNDAVITILTNGVENVISPKKSGDFSAPITLSNGQNILEIIAIAADGQTQSVKKTVTYTEEDF